MKKNITDTLKLLLFAVLCCCSVLCGNSIKALTVTETLFDNGTVVVTINPSPTYNKKDTAVCKGNTLNLQSLVFSISPLNCVVQFYKDSQAQQPINSIVSPNALTKYYFKVTNTTTFCATRVDSVIVGIQDSPADPVIVGPEFPIVCTGSTITLKVQDYGPGYTVVWSKKTNNGKATITPSGVVTGLAYGSEIMTCTVTSSAGCSTSMDIVVRVNISPSITQMLQPAPPCESESLHLSGTATGDNLKYQWLFNGNTIPNATSNTYDIASVTREDMGKYTLTVWNGCADTAKSSVDVGVRWSDLMVVKFYDVILVDNHEDRFVAYQWYFNGEKLQGETKQFYEQKGGLNGTFSVEVTLVDGSKIMTCDTTVFRKKVSSTVKIYPNPVVQSNELIVSLTGNDLDNEITKIQVYNVLGQDYGFYSFTGNEFHLPMNVPVGSYMLLIHRANGETIVEKVIVKH